jgi:hypothetical protein
MAHFVSGRYPVGRTEKVIANTKRFDRVTVATTTTIRCQIADKVLKESEIAGG